jgi:hypothetical protein
MPDQRKFIKSGDGDVVRHILVIPDKIRDPGSSSFLVTLNPSTSSGQACFRVHRAAGAAVRMMDGC